MSDDGFEYCPYCGKSFSDDSEIEVKPEEEETGGKDAENVKEKDAPESDPDRAEGGGYGRKGAPEGDPLRRPDSVPQGWGAPYGYTMPPPPYPYYTQPRRVTPAQKFFSAVGHAILYFLLFMFCQAIVSVIFMYSAIFSSEEVMGIISEYASNPYLTRQDYDEMTERITEAAMDAMDGNLLNSVSIVSAALTTLAVFLVAVAKHRPFSAHVGLYPFHSWLALLLIPIGISAQFLISMVINLIPWPDAVVNDFNGLYSYMGKSDGIFAFVLEILAVAVFAPFVEELIFRGCIYTRLRRGMPAAAAVIIAAFAFGMAHGALIAVFYASLLALLLIFMYEKFGTILAPFLVHLGFNAANYIPLLREDSSTVEIVVTLVVSAVVFSVCLAVIAVSDVGKRDHNEDTVTLPPIPPMPPTPPEM